MRYLLLLFIAFISACNNPPENIALGTLERDRIAHTATTNEVVIALPVTQGNPVTKGMILVQLDNQLQKSQVDKASAQVAQAQANLEKLRHGARDEELETARANVAGAKASLVETGANYKRIVNLKNQNLVSQAQLDTARAARDASQANLTATQEALLILTNGAREEDLRAAEAALNIANATLASETKRLSDLTIVATRDGILDNLPWNLGERVTMGSPLAIVLAGKAPYARIYVPEPYRVKIKTGQQLEVSVDGLESSIIGTVRYISSEPAFTPYYALNQEERSRLMYMAEVQLPESESGLPNGIPVQVKLP